MKKIIFFVAFICIAIATQAKQITVSLTDLQEKKYCISGTDTVVLLKSVATEKMYFSADGKTWTEYTDINKMVSGYYTTDLKDPKIEKFAYAVYWTKLRILGKLALTLLIVMIFVKLSLK